MSALTLTQAILDRAEASDAAPLRLSLLGSQVEQLLNQPALDKAVRFGFSYRELTFQARCMRETQGSALALYAEIANLPYSAEDAVKRQLLLGLIGQINAQRLDFTLHLTPQQKIVLRGRAQLAHQNLPDYIFPPLVRLLHQADPLLDLIAATL
jgi:hypothetical protein